MLTLRRFTRMADIYGADLRRWPAHVRADAQALLTVSPEARAILGDAQVLDEAIDAARAREHATLFRPGDSDAALARVRAGVAARIAASVARRPSWVLPWQLWWLGMAAGSGLAVAVGLLLGTTVGSEPAPDNFLAMLQPAPIHMLAD